MSNFRNVPADALWVPDAELIFDMWYTPSTEGSNLPLENKGGPVPGQGGFWDSGPGGTTASSLLDYLSPTMTDFGDDTVAWAADSAAGIHFSVTDVDFGDALEDEGDPRWITVTIVLPSVMREGVYFLRRIEGVESAPWVAWVNA